jgi:membrane protein DedA with SNARE-associated domain/membrane-associated phospholipid phosphatase
MLATLTSLLSTYGYGLVFGLILFESAGLPLPGETMLVIAAASAASGHLSLLGVILSAALGAIIGDMGGYWIGRKGGSLIFKLILGTAYEEHLIKGQAFFNRYGAASVFLARFVPVVRVISANLAGISAMQYQTFSFYNAAGGLAWATAVGIIGYFFGRNLPLLELLMRRFGIGLVISIGILSFAIWVARLIIHNESKSALVLECFTQRIKFTSLKDWLMKRFSINQQRLIFFVSGLLLVFFFGWMFGSLAEDVIMKDSITRYDAGLGRWLLAHATEDGSEFFFVVTQLASPWVIGLGSLAVSVFLVLRKQWPSLIALVTSVGGGVLLNMLLKNIFLRQRPDFPNAIYYESGYSFPSGHAMVSMLFYGMTAYLLINATKNWKWRVWLGIGTFTLILLIGFSQIALGVHYLTDILSGWSAGLTWLITCILMQETTFYPSINLRQLQSKTK